MKLINLFIAISAIIFGCVHVSFSQSAPAIEHDVHNSSSVGLYHSVWKLTLRRFLDTSRTKDWQQWEHKYDDSLCTLEDAVRTANIMLQSLHDRFTFLADSQLAASKDQEVSDSLVGIGLFLEVRLCPRSTSDTAIDAALLKDTCACVQRVIPGSPAAESNIAVNDRLVFIHRHQGKVDVSSLGFVLAEVGDTIDLIIERRERAHRFILQAAKMSIPLTYVKELPNKIGLIRLYGLGQLSAAQQMEKAIQRLSKAKALVLDLRQNRGGLAIEAIKISSMLLKKGTIGTLIERQETYKKVPQFQRQTITLTTNHLIEIEANGKREIENRQPYLVGDRPIVILVDSLTASAAEMVTAAVQDNENGNRMVTVVGTPTRGKGIGQQTFKLNGGTALVVTTSQFLTPNARWLGDAQRNRHPIVPDVIVSPLEDFDFYSDDDLCFQKALQILTELIVTKK
jgi:carboxyl-terminal processing protease